MNFAYFDSVISPILIASDEWEIIYSNRSAQRKFAILASAEALRSLYDDKVLADVRSVLCTGKICTLPYESENKLSFVFQPCRKTDGSLEYVCVYVASDEELSRELFPLMTENELIKAMSQELIPTMHVISKQLKHAERFLLERNLNAVEYTIRTARKRLLRCTLFAADATGSVSRREGDYCLCDVDFVLNLCMENFKYLKYEPFEPCLVPLEREAMLLVCVDILSRLAFRQTSPKVKASLSYDDVFVTLRFVSGALNVPLEVPCEEDYEGIDLGTFAVRKRIEAVGGSVLVKYRSNKAVTVTLQIPRPRGFYIQPTLEDYVTDRITNLESVALEYLNLIAEENF